MFKTLFKKFLRRQVDAFGAHYNYPVNYMHGVLEADPWAMYQFSKITGISSYRQSIPAAPYYAAKLRAVLFDDCGPCTQLAVNMAQEAGVDNTVLQAVIAGRLADLPDDIALVVRFTDAVLRHDPVADDLRPEILQRWGMQGLISLSFTISSARVYPTMKYALGYGKACQRLTVGDASVAPQLQLTELAT